MRVILLVSMIFWGAGLVQAAEAPRTITVTGVGQAFVEPDLAEVNLGVGSIAKTASAAMAENAIQMAAVFDVLAKSGIEKRDIQTSHLSLHTRWNNHNSSATSQIEGFEATNTVTVRLRNLDTLGPVLDALIKAGANRINGISFSVQDSETLLDQARLAAVKDATEKAALFTAAAGVELGQVMTMREGAGPSRPVPMMRAEAMAMDSVPIAQGEVGLRAEITIIYEIK